MNSKIRNIKSVTRNFIHPEIEMEDFGAALIEFENGSVGFFEATTAAYPKNLEESLYIFAEKGTIKIGGQSVNRIDEWRVENEIEPIEEIQKKNSESPKNIYGNGHKALYKDMIDAIGQDREPYVTLEEAIHSIDLILKVYGDKFND
jgi:predicted dehydrogenase